MITRPARSVVLAKEFPTKAPPSLAANTLLCIVLFAPTARAQEFTYRLDLAEPAIEAGPKVHGVASATVPINGVLNLSDAVFELSFLFLSGALPPAPGPHACGVDPTVDTIGCTETQSSCGD